MNKIRDRRGFSLVELIIAMGVMSILIGSTVGIIGYINTGKTKKASAELNSKLTSIQVNTMTQKGRSYLYLYKTDDGVYYVVSNQDAAGNVGDDGFQSTSELVSYLNYSSGGSKLCDGSVDIITSYIGGGSSTLENLNLSSGSGGMLKIGYNMSTGAFSDSRVYHNSTPGTQFNNLIELSGKQTFSIKLVEKTGKHFIVK